MIKYRLKETEEFEKQFKKLPKDIRDRYTKQFKKVEICPYCVGKSLGCKWFRELKNGCYRAYYIIYEKEVVVLLVDVSNKKNQQDIINIIKQNLRPLNEIVKNI